MLAAPHLVALSAAGVGRSECARWAGGRVNFEPASSEWKALLRQRQRRDSVKPRGSTLPWVPSLSVENLAVKVEVSIERDGPMGTTTPGDTCKSQDSHPLGTYNGMSAGSYGSIYPFKGK